MNWTCKKDPGEWRVSFAIFIVAMFFVSLLSSSSWGDEPFSCSPSSAYEAPPYIEPLSIPPQSRLHLIDNRDGTISDPDSGLLWAQKDSYADLGKCLTWPEALKYVEGLKTAGYTNWRIPTINELSTIYDSTKENNMAWDHNPDTPLALDEKFADGAAYWYWSSDCRTLDSKKCCAKTLYFAKGFIHMRSLDLCNNGGVRAVREIE